MSGSDEVWNRGHPLLLEKINCVFGEELLALNETHESILNGLIGDRIKARGGDPALVTRDEIEGCHEMLYEHFTMASVIPQLLSPISLVPTSSRPSTFDPRLSGTPTLHAS